MTVPFLRSAVPRRACDVHAWHAVEGGPIRSRQGPVGVA